MLSLRCAQQEKIRAGFRSVAKSDAINETWWTQAPLRRMKP